MDPISLLMAAQAAVAAVRKGCEMLSQGKAEIGALKKTVEQGITDVRAVYTEVAGLWAWFKGLISGAPKSAPAPQAALQSPAAPQPVSVKQTKKKPAPEPELSYEEYQTRAIHQVCEQLKTFFEIRRTLKAHCHELEEVAKTTDNIESSAIDRVEIELQLENMTVQVREAMVYAPAELKDIYSRFLQMYGKIIEEQEFERLVRKKKQRDDEARRWLLRDRRIELAVEIAATVLLCLVVAGIAADLHSQSTARSNFWRVSSSMWQSPYLS